MVKNYKLYLLVVLVGFLTTIPVATTWAGPGGGLGRSGEFEDGTRTG